MPILAYCLLLGVFYDTWRADKNIGSIFVIIHPSPDRLTPPCKVDNLQNANYTPPLPPPQPASITRKALSPDLRQTVHFSSDNRNKKQEIFQKTIYLLDLTSMSFITHGQKRFYKMNFHSEQNCIYQKVLHIPYFIIIIK